jgi:arsenate reductase
MLFICYPKCGTCKKAGKWLDEREIKHETRDIKKDNPSEMEIAEWRQKSGLPLKKFFNTSGNSYNLFSANMTMS